MQHWDEGYCHLMTDNLMLVKLLNLSNSADSIYTRICQLEAAITVEMSPGRTAGMSPLETLRSQLNLLVNFSDECLFIIRKEIRLHAYFYLNQISQDDLDIRSKRLQPQNCVVRMNRDLLMINSSLQSCKSFSLEKRHLIFGDICKLLPHILTNALRGMAGRTLSDCGIQLLQSNLLFLKQTSAQLCYDYEDTGLAVNSWTLYTRCDRYNALIICLACHFTRLYQLLNLPQVELQTFFNEYSQEYSKEECRSISHMVTKKQIPTNRNISNLNIALGKK